MDDFIRVLEALPAGSILGFCLLTIALVYRRPAGAALKNLANLTFRRGDVELVVNTEKPTENPANEHSATPQLVDEAENGQKDHAVDSGIEQPPERGVEQTTFAKLTTALDKRDFKEAEAVFKTLQSETEDMRQKYGSQGYYYSRLYVLGDDSALDKLQELANTNKAKDVYYAWMGTTYERLKQFPKAASYYQRAATYADSAENTAQFVALAAKALHAAGDMNTATAILEDAIANMTDEAALAALYKGLASTYKIEDNQFLRAIATEKAITYEPNATYLMFNAGYAYSEASFRDLAVLHYKNLLQLRPKDESALNNLGVEFDRGDMPLKSVAAYKQASTEGNTLATANLAYKLIDTGFQEEALALLDEAAKQNDVHENVPHARSHLESDKQKEDKAEQEMLKRGKVSQSFLQNFAEAYFSKCDNVTIGGD